MTTLDLTPIASNGLTGRGGMGCERTAADLSSLLVELSRLVKALSFYAVGSAQRKALLDRAFLAWQADLARSGPLTLMVGTDGFSSPGLDGTIEYNRIYNVASALASRRIQKLRFVSSLSHDAFGAFAQLLSGESEIVVEGPSDPHLWSLENEGLELSSTSEASATGPEPTPARVPASSPAAAETRLAVHPEAQLASASTDEVAAAEDREEVPGPESEREEAPIAALADRRATELAAALEVLEDCDADDDYAALSNQIATTAAELAREGRSDDAYSAALVLADHAIGGGGRSESQAQKAQQMLTRLATEALLPDLISRACSKLAVQSVRAAQLLLQLGEHAAPALFDALLRERAGERAAALCGLLIALAEAARDELERQLQRPPNGPQARLAVRLAGEMQNPALAPVLAGLLSAADGVLRVEAARALMMLGGATAVDSLVVALSSPDDELAELAALCLGELGDRRAAHALIRELEGTAAAGRLDCSREIARALGQIGAEEAVPGLAATLGLRGITQRRRRRELKLAAVASLGKLRSVEAHVALTRAARMGEIRVRERAQQILTRSAAAATG